MSRCGRESLTRYPERGSDERTLLDALLDEVLVATVSTVVDGEPWTVPTLFARDGDRILIHGSTGAGLMRHLASGAPATVTVFQLDALVVADSAFDSSANYRSAVLRGNFEPVPADEADGALWALTNRLLPARQDEVRQNLPKELAATLVLALPITDGQWIFKSRSGPASGPDEVAPSTWVGVVPVQTVFGEPVADDRVPADVAVPASVQRLRSAPGRPRLFDLPGRLADGDLVLERFTTGTDVSGLWAALPEDVWTHVPGGHPSTPDALRARMVTRICAPDPVVTWVVLFDGQPVGTTSHFPAEQTDAVEIGATYMAPTVWGTGLNARVKALMVEAAGGIGALAVLFQTDERNARSAAAILKLGAHATGTRLESVVRPDGTRRTSRLFELPLGDRG